jgi:stalled ribosome alternative rescue factor ArfA
MKKWKIEKRRKRTNPVASELKDKRFRQRVVRPDKIYNRSKMKKELKDEDFD